MAKQKRKDAEALAREKLADAQAKLATAQERRRRISTEGEKEVELARQRAAVRLDKVTKEVERRAAKVARAEARLLGLQTRQKPKAVTPPPPLPVIEVEEQETASPTAAADRLEEIADESAPSPVLHPNGVEASPARAEAMIGRNERRLLEALHENFDEAGATFSQWLEASTLSKKTFLRARKTLVEGGLVAHNGSGLGARYALTDSGRSETAGSS